MTKSKLLELVESQLREFRYEVPADALGRPWSDEKVRAELRELQASLVAPALERCEMRDTFDQMRAESAEYRELWVVAVDGARGFKVFYDPEAEEFCLATFQADSVPQTIGVRGDLVSTFMAR